MEKEMEKFDYRKVLVNGKEYECARTKTGRVYLFYYENGIEKVYVFDDTMRDRCLSKGSYFVTPCNMILEARTIDFVDFETRYTTFTARIQFF